MCKSRDSQYMSRQQILADDLCVAFANGSQDSSTYFTGDLCPGVSYLSMAVPGPLREASFFTSGNLTERKRAPPAVIPANKAAAGLAFYQRRWFHVSRDVSGLDYWDLRQAFALGGCSSVLCIPITLQPPAWGPAVCGSQPAPSAVGVLTVGFAMGAVVDAGLLTSLFYLAQCMAPRAATLMRSLLQRCFEAGQPEEGQCKEESDEEECPSSSQEDSARPISSLQDDGASDKESLGLALRGGDTHAAGSGSSSVRPAATPAVPKKCTSTGLELMIAFATQRRPKGAGQPTSAAGCFVLLAMSCVAYCFLQLSRLKQSRVVMSGVAVCCLIGLATLCPLVFPSLRAMTAMDQPVPSFS